MARAKKKKSNTIRQSNHGLYQIANEQTALHQLSTVFDPVSGVCTGKGWKTNDVHLKGHTISVIREVSIAGFSEFGFKMFHFLSL